MFGCCVAGRPLQTNLQTIDDTHAVFELPHASSINHVCVFLLGTVPFPDGFGATVHLFWPGKGFQLLGMLSNEKPSAIFRLRGTFSSTTSHSISSAISLPSPSPAPENPMGPDVNAVLGIAIEPLDAIQAQIATLNASLAKPAPPSMEPTLIAEKVVKNLFNFVSGFANGVLTPDTPVPFGIIMRWYDQFLGKVRAGGIGFLEREA